jgi:3-methyl-2-oxobutanoate hydroxymethyltransferase
MEDAVAVEQAGASALVIEGVPRDLAAEITRKVSIPTIGIGAGPDCDGQVLVLHDVLGLTDTRLKFTQAYADLRAEAIRATAAYIDDVTTRRWPDDEHSFH